MKRFYNKKTLLEEINKLGFNLSYPTLYNYQNRGLLKSAGMLDNGNRKVPIYDDRSVADFLNKVEELKAKGKVRLKIYK